MGTSPALYLHTDGTLIGYYESGGTNNLVQSTESLVGTGWRHVAVSIDAANSMTIYIDGKAITTSAPVGAIDYDNSPDTYIGRAGDGLGGFDFDGKIDDARVYSRALSADEIVALASDQPVAVGTDLTQTFDRPNGDSGAANVLYVHSGFGGITSDGAISALQLGPDNDNTVINFDFIVLRANGGNLEVVHRVSLTDSDVVSTDGDGVRTLDIGSLDVQAGDVIGHWSPISQGAIPYSVGTGGTTGWSSYASSSLDVGDVVQESLDTGFDPNRVYGLNVLFEGNSAAQTSDNVAITVTPRQRWSDV